MKITDTSLAEALHAAGYHVVTLDMVEMARVGYEAATAEIEPTVNRLRICAECGMCAVESCPALVMP